MDANASLHAQLAAAAYMSPEEADVTAQKLGYKLEQSDADRMVFANNEGHAVVAFRGTDLKRPKNAWRDLLTDAAVLFGKQERTPRFMKSEQVIHDAMSKYKRVTATGHSLGGSQSVHVARQLGIEAHSFNPGYSLPDVVRSFKDRIFGNTRHIKHTNNVYTTSFDPISMASHLALNAHVHRVNPKEKNPHSLRNFL